MVTVEQAKDDEALLARLIADAGILRALVAQLPLPIFVADADGRLELWNALFEAAHPEGFRDGAPRTLQDVWGPEVARRHPADLVPKVLARRQEALRTEGWHDTPAGGPVLHIARPSGGVLGLGLGTGAEGAASAAWHRSVLEALPISVVVFDAEGQLLAWNECARRHSAPHDDLLVAGRTRREMLVALTERGHFKDLESDVDPWVEWLMTHHPADDRILPIDTGHYHRLHQCRTPEGLTVISRVDVTALAEARIHFEAKSATLARAIGDMRHQALHDALTGLPNRRYLDAHMAEQAENAGARRAGLGLLHIDLDRFKQINDTLGHAAGDAVLRQAADVLRDACRAEDFVARVGGDEFVMVTPDVGTLGEDGLIKLGQRIVADFLSPITIDGQECRVGASVGIALDRAGDLAMAPSDLLTKADIALYRAKERGRGRVEVFSPRLEAEMRRNKRLADEILSGLEAREFFPIYQPQVYGLGQGLRGVETLCRWRHPIRGMLTPADFMEVARNAGLLDDIDRQILDMVRRDLALMAARGLRIPRISFNMTVAQLLDPAVLVDLKALREMVPDVAVELMEQPALEMPDDRTQWVIEALREAELRIEIDDFGSSNASIVGLMNVRPDTMKIDQRIVGPMVSSDRHFALVKALIDIGQALSIEVVAEGVETSEHIAKLDALGCDAQQGFGHARPMEVETLATYLMLTDQVRPAG